MQKKLLECKNNCEDDDKFFGLLLAPKINYCLTKNKNGIVDEHKTFETSTNVFENQDGKEYIKSSDSDELIAKVSLSWKKSFDCGVKLSHKLRHFCECKNNYLWNKVINVTTW